MVGKPKYNKGDIVKFKINDDVIEGEIIVVDRFGVFENDTDVHYDIIGCQEKYQTLQNPKGECIFKHIIETSIIN